MKSSHLLKLIASLLLLSGIGYWVSRDALSDSRPIIPAFLTDDLSPECSQVMLVRSPFATSIHAQLWLLERNATQRWNTIKGPIPVTLGRNGLAWGTGEHTCPPPNSFRLKREGDGCSPAGIFQIPFASGMAPKNEAQDIRLPYTHLTQAIIGVDDPTSRYYNQVIDATGVERDWATDERMNRYQKVYRWGAFIANNPDAIPEGGSCIFLHLWPRPGRATAGCTAMSEEDILTCLRWLDPARQPRIIQVLESW